MTAFNEVMTAEQEAEQAIQTAKEAALAAVAEAEEAKRVRLVKVEAELTSVAQAETLKQQGEIEDAGKKITDAAEATVAAVRQRFTSRKAEAVKILKGRFQ
jgi:vacuolar-type H+-ATPase subunit H